MRHPFRLDELAVACAAAIVALVAVGSAPAARAAGPLDGTWTAEFTVETSSVGLARPGQSLTGLTFTISGATISGDFSGTVSLTPIIWNSSTIYLGNVTSAVLGSDAACSGEIYFSVQGSPYVGTRFTDSITCRGGTITGRVDGYGKLSSSSHGTPPASTNSTSTGGNKPPTSSTGSKGAAVVTFSGPATVVHSDGTTAQASSSLAIGDTVTPSSAPVTITYDKGKVAVDKGSRLAYTPCIPTCDWTLKSGTAYAANNGKRFLYVNAGLARGYTLVAGSSFTATKRGTQNVFDCYSGQVVVEVMHPDFKRTNGSNFQFTLHAGQETATIRNGHGLSKPTAFAARTPFWK